MDEVQYNLTPFRLSRYEWKSCLQFIFTESCSYSSRLLLLFSPGVRRRSMCLCEHPHPLMCVMSRRDNIILRHHYQNDTTSTKVDVIGQHKLLHVVVSSTTWDSMSTRVMVLQTSKSMKAAKDTTELKAALPRTDSNHTPTTWRPQAKSTIRD